MVQHFDEIGIIQSAERLAHFIVVYQDKAVARRIEGIALAADADVMPFIVHHPEFGAFFVQNARHHVANAVIGGKTGHIGIAGFGTRPFHNFGNTHLFPARVGTHRFLQKRNRLSTVTSP